MILYHYRSIESALTEIENCTFHFAALDELNDPIEGYVRLFWKGDKAAWEGLFRNYVCSLSQAIDLWLLHGNEDILHHKSLITDIHRFDNVPLGEILEDIGDHFLMDGGIQKLASFYGDNHLKAWEEELRLIFHSIHNKAFALCIQKKLERGGISEEMGNVLQKVFSKEFPFPFEKMEAELQDEAQRSQIAKNLETVIEDSVELYYIQIGFRDEGFLYGRRGDRKDADTEARLRRNWMAVAADFPRIYVNELKEIIYPASYVVCFSRKNDDSAMWGNYADHHRGVCLIYKTEDSNKMVLRGRHRIPMSVRPIKYEGELIECNFFETLGCLPRKQIVSWLTGTEGISSVYDAYSPDDEWRERYWNVYAAKTYRKLKAWKHEEEYRVALTDTFYEYSELEGRNLKYDPKILRGVIFGISTSEYDKKRIMEKLRIHMEELADFKFSQAEYDGEAQKIIVREKKAWKLK
ncbi:MAG: DUF2971 domain-containing protein [Rikenellaceae bacterium]|nr:DUF2971 domain-containing protein [Rikenellaceae bacterium]